MTDWVEVGDRCWVRRYDEWDLNVGLVVGADGALVIDTRATTEEAEQLRENIRELTDVPVKWVVNTHAHFDHVAGNSVFTDATVHLHENAAALDNGEKLAGTTFVDEDYKRRIAAGATSKNIVVIEYRCIPGPDQK